MHTHSLTDGSSTDQHWRKPIKTRSMQSGNQTGCLAIRGRSVYLCTMAMTLHKCKGANPCSDFKTNMLINIRLFSNALVMTGLVGAYRLSAGTYICMGHTGDPQLGSVLFRGSQASSIKQSSTWRINCLASQALLLLQWHRTPWPMRESWTARSSITSLLQVLTNRHHSHKMETPTTALLKWPQVHNKVHLMQRFRTLKSYS